MDANADGRTSAASGSIAPAAAMAALMASWTPPNEHQLLPPQDSSHKGAKQARKEVEKPQPQPQPLSAEEARVGDGLQPLTADEARAAAAAEGLELMPSSSSETGFKGVYKEGLKYSARIRAGGKKRFLGLFTTPEEAAFNIARHVGAERAAEEARGDRPQPLTADEARAAAAAEGLELMPSSSSETGFRNVYKEGLKYRAKIGEGGRPRRLGLPFATPEEAALCFARHVGAERAAAEARGDRPQPLTADEARAAAAAEGLELMPSSSSETGFRGVYKERLKYRAKIFEGGKPRCLGLFATPEEAALCFARHVGAERAAAEARGRQATAAHSGRAQGGE